MPTFTKSHGYSDKENADAHGQEGPGGHSHQPSEKLKQLTAKQQELTKHHGIKAQRECKHLQLCQLDQEGSKTDKREGYAGDDQYGIDDNNDGDDRSQFTSCVIMTRLSGRSKEHLSHRKNKVPRAPPAKIDIDQREIAASNNEDVEEPCSTPHSLSDCQSTQHKKSKDQHFHSSTPPEVEVELTIIDEREVQPSILQYLLH
ncbi:hypothetical protein EDD16DRAFT_1527203 [Pisolithus croceorrhizus]|nr:hypothetical protein EDD16DRAFT_1527203 [Pisolithus croceorrhizus]